MCRPIRLPESVIMPNGPARCSTSRVRACTIRRSWSSARCSACRRTPTANVVRYATVVFRWLAARWPTRPPKREKKAAVPRYFNYLHVRCAGSTLLAKRTGRDIWRNLYEFPLIETPRAVDFGELQRTARWREWFDEAGDVRVSGMLPMPRHVLSHRVIHAWFLSGRPADLAGRIVVLSESSFVGNIPLPCLAADRALSGARGVSLPEAGEGAPALCRHVR